LGKSKQHRSFRENKVKLFSLGVAHTSDMKNLSIDELIFISDKRLYKAKELGRNQVCSQ